LSALEKKSQQSCFGGSVGFYAHASTSTATTMRFGVFLPQQAGRERVPAVYYLAGLTCNEETFLIKAGAQRFAAHHGLALIAPDTSPRGAGIPGEDDDWDFGTGAGFYLDATAAPYAQNYNMGRYVNEELPALIEAEFPIRSDARGIFGHSMGGHGALVSAFRHPGYWHSVSAFAPISNPTAVPWGKKALPLYLGEDEASWADWDASLLMRRRAYPGLILIDQGEADQFLETQLKPESLEASARASGQALELRRHAGYDHSYWFIQSFVEDHLAHHARQLLNR
jgi:S-formylglutathione hydrolase